ncbi:MAG TPA: DUF4172 domain-containing protein [Fimbriimonadaceae bacterium]|nr:DUF4172 domain-containing protein [Fimbriimonadaceae bacterium]
MSTEAVTTSEIEGEILDRGSVQSSIQRQLGLAADNRRSGPKEQGIAEMMVDLYRGYDRPLSSQVLFLWHKMLMAGSRHVSDVGKYRTGDAPMQIVSGRMDSPKVYFEAPPSTSIPSEMKRFILWFNETGPRGKRPLPALTRAGIAHLYFESIHPFEDGNGRIGRAIAEMSLAQSLEQPALVGLASTIMSRRAAYYDALQAASMRNEVTDWLAWFAGVAIESQRRTAASVEFLIQKTKLLDRLRGELNARQEKALMRMFREGPQGFKGGFSAGNYASITGASAATTTRDLLDLVEKKALTRTGELKHTRYHLEIPTSAPRRVTILEDGTVAEE